MNRKGKKKFLNELSNNCEGYDKKGVKSFGSCTADLLCAVPFRRFWNS